MVAASVRQQTPMTAGHSSTASGSTSSRMRKRPREDGSSSAIKRQRTNAGFTEQTRNSSAARAIQLQQISALTSSLARNESFNMTASRSISNPNLPQQSTNPPPSAVPVCASCRRVPVPNDEAGGSHQPQHPCNCQVFHTCNNGCLLNQPQFFRPNPIPPPPPTQPMMMYERPGSSAHRVRDGEQPFPCVPTAMSQMDSTMFGLLSSQLNQISAHQRLQRMVPQSQLTVPPFFNRNYINAPRNTSNFNLGLAATALHPEQVNLLNTRQQQNAERNEQMNNFYRQHNPQRLVQVQTQTTSEILRNQTLQNNPMIIVPGFNPSNNGIEMISFLMNGHDGALYVPHAEATAHVAHAMNHEPQPIGASSECIKQCTTIKSYIKDPEVPEQETERCTVCLLDFETGDEIRTLHCNHIYHIDCIDRWLQYNKKCPVCRLDMDKAPIVIDDTEEEQAANAIGITAQ
uniref:RING-type domain-containing protein n=3 Tax=Bursaphelenchus xylophilus TaxID=6326 RepID=A0A1I7S700_BURXY